MGSLGNPVRLILTAGQACEYSQENALIAGFSAHYILAEKGYGSDAFILAIRSAGAEPVIPPGKGRLQPRSYDRELYRERNLAERLCQKLKLFRRMATRYERLGCNYLGMLQLTVSLIWLA